MSSNRTGRPPGRPLVSQVGGGARIHALLRLKGGRPVWTDRLLGEMEALQSAPAETSISPPGYPHASEDLHLACTAFVPSILGGSPSSAAALDLTPLDLKHRLRAAVFSSISPWAELTMRACLRACARQLQRPAVGAAAVGDAAVGRPPTRGRRSGSGALSLSLVTVDYNPPLIAGRSALATSMASVSPSALRDSFAADGGEARPFDVAVAFSGIEHDGLGRYADPIAPRGDLAAMVEIHATLQRAGLLFLAVPTCSRDALIYPANRCYGPRRLRMLLAAANFTLLGRVWDGKLVLGGIERADESPSLWQPDIRNWSYQQVLVLRRE